MFANAYGLAPVFAGFLASLGVTLLYIIFFFSSALLIVIILLQEGKGGGFTAAFGGVGTEAFGVKAGGINKLTSVLAGIFVVSALILGVVTKGAGTVATDLETELNPGANAPMQPASPGGTPASPGGTPTSPGGTQAGTPPTGGTPTGEGAAAPTPKTPESPPSGPEKGKAESPPPAKGESSEAKG